MGRHAADRQGKPPLHSDLFAPTPGSAAARAAQARAERAFESLVEPHRAALAAYVLRLTGGDEEAADKALKETFYRAAQDPSRYPQRASAVRPWLVLTARLVLRDGARFAPAGHDDRPTASVPERPPVSRPAPTVSRPATTVVRAMDDLAAAHRDVLVELFYRGISLEDAAAARGVPVETLKSRLYFAMSALRAVLDQQISDRHGPQG
jgi:RNA polymerase sigma-70 factor (ECF subfamily)